MTEIIGVRFKSGGKQYYFDPNGQAVAPGQGVIIETSRGLEYGECTQGNTMVEDEAVVTSGGYERYFEQDGVRYWHILDPATGQPARTGLLSVTVVGPSGTVCDALSTALFVMGPERVADYWLAREDFDFLLLHEDGSVTCSEGLEGRLTLSGDWADREIEVVRR